MLRRRTSFTVFAVGTGALSLAALGSPSDREASTNASEMRVMALLPAFAPTQPTLQNYPPDVEIFGGSSASWAWSYGSLSMLAAGSDLVGTGIARSARPYIGENGTAYTEYTIQLQRVVKGDESAPDSVVVLQTGGVLGDIAQEIADDPLIHVGSEMLLFLKGSDQPGGGRIYFAIGGPQGRYPVSAEGMVGALGDLYPERDIDQVNGIAGRPLDDVLAEAETYRDLPPLDYRHPVTPQDPNYRPRE